MKSIFHDTLLPLIFAAIMGACAVSLSLLLGCESQPKAPTQDSDPEKPLALAWDGKHKDAQEWTQALVFALQNSGQDLLKASPDDIKEWCPGFAKLDQAGRLEFWAQLIAKTAQFESAFKPETSFYECSKTSNAYGASAIKDPVRGWCMAGGHPKDGGLVISRGLMQMSLASAQGYRCPVSDPAHLHDPGMNLDCAVRVLNRLVPHPREFEGAIRGHGRLAGKTDGKWRGGAAYWAVLRDSSGYAKESHDKIRTFTRGLGVCQ